MPSNKKLLQAAAGNAGGTLGYVEDVFSSYLYVGGTNSNKITNGIDLAGEGGLVWVKNRGATQNNWLLSADLGSNSPLSSNLSASAATNVSNWFGANPLYTFNNDGFTTASQGQLQTSNNNYASLTFRKAEKFFDVVTYTGNGTAGRTVAHNLGSTPGMIIIKKTSGSSNWPVYHSSRGLGKELFLNERGPETSYGDLWSGVTSTNFTISSNNQVNYSGDTYVAYLFASDAGGFGDDGDENIIKCGSFNSSAVTDLGFEPQFIMMKNATGNGDWFMLDVKRGFTASTNTTTYSGINRYLEANTVNVEEAVTGIAAVHGKGFASGQGGTYIYVAIRRPMKTPESGTEVYKPDTYSGNGSTTATLGSGIVCAGNVLTMIKAVNNSTQHVWVDTLRGGGRYLQPNGNNAEVDNSAYWTYDFKMDGWTINASGSEVNSGSWNYVAHTFKRAPGFMDVCAVTTSGYAATVTHNLGVTPELIIGKARNSASYPWTVWNKDLNIVNSNYTLQLSNATAGANNGTPINSVGPTTFYAAIAAAAVEDQAFFIFATLAGISKVGTYTGTAGNLNVACGFSNGARFILIKRTDSTGDWYVWNSASGISASGTNDPYLRFNDNAAEVTNTDYIALLSSGFTVTSSAPAALNASGGSYLFLAIA